MAWWSRKKPAKNPEAETEEPAPCKLFYVGDEVAAVTKYFRPLTNVTVYANDRSRDLLEQYKQIAPNAVLCDFDAPDLDLLQFIIDMRHTSEVAFVHIYVNNFPEDVPYDHGTYFIKGIKVYGPTLHLKDFPHGSFNLSNLEVFRRLLA